MAASAAKVMAPLQLLLPLTLSKAAFPSTPPPASDKASAPTAIIPSNCNVAPLATVTPPAVVPVP